MSQRRIEEGFRVLTLTADVDEDVLDFIRRYQVLASHIYWARRLGISPDPSVLEELRSEVKAYWRWHVIDERDPMYLFKGVKETPRPYSVILKLPLVDALHPSKGAYLKDGRLVLRLNRVVEVEIPKRALEWLNKRLAENPDRKTVRVFERDGRLVVQIVLHKRNVVERPGNPLLVVVDLNSSHGIVVHYWDGKLIKTKKYRPPNRGWRWRQVRRLMMLRDRLYNLGTITQRQINIYSSLIRTTLRGSAKPWIQQVVDRVVRRIRRIARRRGKEPLVMIDTPSDESLRNSSLQRTLRSFAKYLENILSWYGIYWEERRLYSTLCPVCGTELRLKMRTKNTRIMECPKCGFNADRDTVPLHWAIKSLSALKSEAS
ncbi:zinc ribbon domain-containing protein [Vulcanisaeta sp. JCM 14467]